MRAFRILKQRHFITDAKADEFLDNFFIGRISSDLLMSHYLLLSDPDILNEEGRIGAISTAWEPEAIVDENFNEHNKNLILNHSFIQIFCKISIFFSKVCNYVYLDFELGAFNRRPCAKDLSPAVQTRARDLRRQLKKNLKNISGI